jgi:hypothetical protein
MTHHTPCGATLRTLALAALTLAGAHAQAAPLQNGSFSAGLSNWAIAGDVSVQTGTVKGYNLGSTPTLVLGNASTAFDDDAPAAAGALNVSGLAPVEAPAMEAALGLAAGSLSNPGQNFSAQEGSVVTQSFFISAGQTVSFDWRLLAQPDGNLSSVPDTAWLSLTLNGAASLIKLGDVSSLSTTVGGWLDSGLQHYSLTASQGGTATLGFAMADINSYSTTSLLAIQSVSLSATPAVPEPDGIFLILTGLGLAWGVSRRHGQR